MSFFNTLSGVCKGTEIFLQLFRLSPWKALWHLLILTTLCAIFITTAKTFPLYKDIDIACDTITEQFGRIKFTDKGILPSVEPEKARVVQLTEIATVAYIPDLQTAPLPDFDHESTRGVFWSPGIVAGWYKTDANEYLLIPLIYAPEKARISTRPFQKDAIMAYLKENSSVGNPLGLPFSSVSAADRKIPVKICVTLITFGLQFIQILFQTIVLTSLFTMIFNLVGSRNFKILKFRNIFVTAIYAGFPAIIIASFFPAFDLPLDFNTVYIFCFAVYFIYIMSRLERDLSGEKPEAPADDDFM
ncbi:MAG: hypothetical protein WCV67_10405 [Victivallaceae bacterium]|jgi:hypothetical protein